MPPHADLRRAVAILVAAVAAVATACGGAGRVDTREVERGLIDDFVPVEGVTVDAAECPNQVDRGTGGSFLCTVSVDGQSLSVRVVQTDDEGGVRIEQQQVVFEASQLAADVASEVGRELGQPVTATCGDSAVVVVDVGDEVACDVVDESGGVLVVSAQIGDEGVVSVEPA